jgi:hypothetical protein
MASRTLSSSFTFPRSRGQRNLADQPQPVSRSHGLLLPTAHEGVGGPPDAGFTCPLRSAFRVWLPSWRLAPSDTAPAFFRTGSAPGIRPSELSPRERYPRRYRLGGPTYRSSCRSSGTEAPTGPTGRGFWALTLSRVPRDRTWVEHADRRMLPWVFAPSRALQRGPWPRFHPASSHALSNSQPKTGRPRRPRVSISLRPRSDAFAASRAHKRAALIGFMHRHAPNREGPLPARAIGFTDCRAVHCCRQAGHL